MAQATFSIRMDAEIKKEFESLCKEFGMSPSTAFNLFARAVVRERKIPFEIAVPTSMADAYKELRRQAKEGGVQGMSLEEINEEISKARKGID